MNRWCLLFAFGLFLTASQLPRVRASMWEDIVSCVYTLSNDSSTQALRTLDDDANGGLPSSEDISTFEIFTLICGNRDRFVRCLDHSLKDSKDGVTRVIGSLFESERVIRAYNGLCSNISSIEQTGSDVFGCLSTTKLTACQDEVADFFFYMGLVKRLGAPSEQLAQNTMEELLCSLTNKRRLCEVQALKECSSDLGDVMDDFYRQTQPNVCTPEEDGEREEEKE